MPNVGNQLMRPLALLLAVAAAPAAAFLPAGQAAPRSAVPWAPPPPPPPTGAAGGPGAAAVAAAAAAEEELAAGPHLGAEDEELAAYSAAMEEVLSSDRTYRAKDPAEDRSAVRGYLLGPRRVVPLRLPTLEGAEGEDEGGGAESLRTELDGQREALCTASGLTCRQHRMALDALTYLGHRMAKAREGAGLTVAWDKMKEMGALPRENTLSTYLYCLGLGGDDDGEAGAGAEAGGGAAAAEVALEEVARVHDLLYQPTEKTLSLRIKSMVRRGDPAAAERMLDQMPGEKKLRTYYPVLEAHCAQADLGPAFRLYKRMRRAPGVILNAELYSILLAALAEGGCFGTDAGPVPGAEELGYDPPMGPGLLDGILSEMAEDVLEIPASCADRLGRALRAGHGTGGEVKGGAPAEGPGPASDSDLVAGRVTIDGDSGECPRTGATLRLIALDRGQRAQLHDTLLDMANSQYDIYSEKLKQRKQTVENEDDGYARRELLGFSNWMDEREGEPFTAIVDGANVAFFGRGIVDYQQIKMVVNGLEDMGERPLIIIPQKYAHRKFHVRRGFIQELNEEAMAIVEELEEAGKLYKVPKRCLDDYYWMLASVSDQTNSRNGAEIDVTPNNGGRWPGLRPMLVSNDQMRDHKLELLQPRLFRRWVSSFIIKYGFAPVGDDESDDREVSFLPVDLFSKEIQGNPTQNGVTAWHFPVGEWDENERFCIRLPKQ